MLALSLEPGEVDLWCVDSGRDIDGQLLDAYRGLLSEQELAHERRLAMPEVRLQFLLSRALARTVLSCYTSEDPRCWVFETNAYGKPFVASPPCPSLRFNLSHTRGMVVCGATLAEEIGVDVEELRRVSDHLQLARRYFAAAEARALEALPAADQWRAFFEFWTLKEAFVKARGRGLSIPLDDFAFSLSPDHVPRISFHEAGGEDPGCWQFAQLCIDSRFQMAVAVHRSATRRLAIRVRQTVPLRWIGRERMLPESTTNGWTIRLNRTGACESTHQQAGNRP
jgi:4'-phosphopantetheinyl transferase